MPRPALPDTVEVGPFTYRVVVGGPDWDASRISEMEPNLVGHHSPARLVIALQPGLAPGAEREVFLHELLHACFNAVGQPLAAMTPDEPEENAIRTLSPMLLAVLRANPAVTAYLTGS